jgi:hypothetical protein
VTELNEISSVLDDFAQAVIGRAQRNLGATRTVAGKKRRAVATGNLKNSLSFVKSETQNFSFVNFTASGSARDYANVVEYGRRKGAKMPPVDAIKKWIKQKPVRLQKKGGGFIPMTEKNLNTAAFLIARSIAKRGTPEVRYYRDAVEAELEERGPAFLDALEKEIAIRFNLGR